MGDIEHEAKIEVSLSDYEQLKKTADQYANLHKALLEYMGYEEEFLITRPGFKRMTKEELITIIFEQRSVIRKLIGDLEASKREEHIRFLDTLYMNRIY
ncbi:MULTISPECIES: hypothetical protein [Bacillaceae]|uniref:hypothetical protein n=1 Tax=Bacillaceae TaxID=186817 RepID=UPI000E707074|nr:hypothetical protein [Bacillus sp. PK3_68]RJS59198.1 hypothetical protein CJ483_03215 [Bacillus sp. PK3_68]